ncbi:ATP12-domain-containing protein [Parathielavia hyrcaniae]|uniref:ATP12-domain-containing protein n=1 Tax=Parathielavia hyrcaniae TaxID=113614 RepID=A0AAN6T306_9PEZI|nr:ATP12-domain-containing protein [Parathielavia hyrcaniae]
MSPATRLCVLLPLRPVASPVYGGAAGCTRAAAAVAARAIHSNPAQPAKVVSVYGTGPPPEPPHPDPEFAAQDREQRLARRRRQAELLKRAGDLRALRQQQRDDAKGTETGGGGGGGLKRRFWKDVHVREVNGALEIHLDTSPLRHPTTKSIIRLPRSKPHLAHALALEWDNLVSAQQATKQHLIPLTSLICRALDIASSDSTPPSSSSSSSTIRPTITTTLLRYLDTDSLLCLSPPPAPGEQHDPSKDGPSLRARQDQAYASTTTYLTAHVWPGVSIVPVLDDGGGGDSHSLLPQPQAPGTREAVQAWIASLSPFELAGLERAALAGKSLLAAARLVVEWSEDGAGAGSQSRDPLVVGKETEEGGGIRKERFGVEEAARAVSLEVDWQTGRWGEVEDTHDVEKEDVRRQLGSVVLLVSGNGAGVGE